MLKTVLQKSNCILTKKKSLRVDVRGTIQGKKPVKSQISGFTFDKL